MEAVFTGYLEMGDPGSYQLCLECNDICYLYVDDQLLVSGNSCGAVDGVSVKKVEIMFRQYEGDHALILRWITPTSLTADGEVIPYTAFVNPLDISSPTLAVTPTSSPTSCEDDEEYRFQIKLIGQGEWVSEPCSYLDTKGKRRQFCGRKKLIKHCPKSCGEC